MIALMMAEDPLEVGSTPITLMPALLVSFLLSTCGAIPAGHNWRRRR